MKFIIKEFSIISPTEKESFNTQFKKGINLIVGEKDSGKTSLARAILYTLGCDVKNFDFLTSSPDNIYIIDFRIGSDEYILIRKRLKIGRGKNFFKIIKNYEQINVFYDTNLFKDYINKIMNINIQLMNRNGIETKLYPNHIFLPFYTDQDYSWHSYMTGTFNGINFIQNYKKSILEYFTGARGNDYYDLKLKKDDLKNNFNEVKYLIQSKENIYKDNYQKIKIIENIDFSKFQKQYQHALDIYEEIIDYEHSLKYKVNEKIYEKNSYLEISNKLELALNVIIKKEEQKDFSGELNELNNTMEDDYKLQINKQNLIAEKEKIDMYIFDLDKDINERIKELKQIKGTSSDFKQKLDSDAKTINLIERANGYALNQINEVLINEITILKEKLIGLQDELQKIEKKLLDLNNKDISVEYKKSMIDAFEKLNIPFSYNNYYNSNLESVRINLSGATKVQAYIAQYLSIYDLIIDNENTIDIPMFIDTFLKDDFNFDEITRTSEYIFDSLQDKFQTFIFIANNEQTLTAIKKYKYNVIELTVDKKLLHSNYLDVSSKYSNWLIE